MTIHKSFLGSAWYVRDLNHKVIFRGAYEACQQFVADPFALAIAQGNAISERLSK